MILVGKRAKDARHESGKAEVRAAAGWSRLWVKSANTVQSMHTGRQGFYKSLDFLFGP